jgi:hypothetical protein
MSEGFDLRFDVTGEIVLVSAEVWKCIGEIKGVAGLWVVGG